VIYPTSDTVSWLLSRYRPELEPLFFMYQPSESAIWSLLDKKLLFEAGRRLQLDAPATYFPADIDELRAIAPDIRYPAILKPRTQVLSRGGVKGKLVRSEAELTASFNAFAVAHSYDRLLLDRHPAIAIPMVQEFHQEARDCIYSLTGFISREGKMVTLASAKVLQYPRRLGIGLCFEHDTVRNDLVDAIAGLCSSVGYFGVFEAEFIDVEGNLLLIDFNPRFYSQLAFEVNRGLPLPLLAYEAAIGGIEGINPNQEFVRDGAIYVRRDLFKLLLGTQRLCGRMSAGERTEWLDWYSKGCASATEAAFDEADRWPGIVDRLRNGVHVAQHPRSFVRRIALDRVD
jgi:predicted ATP-grasp superfamily ATP-dependent carboligase